MVVFNFLLVVFSALLFFCLSHELFERYREKKEKLDIVGSIMFAIIGISTLIDAFVNHTTPTIIARPIVSIIFLVALICCFLGCLDSYRKEKRALDIIKAVIMAAGIVLMTINLIFSFIN